LNEQRARSKEQRKNEKQNVLRLPALQGVGKVHHAQAALFLRHVQKEGAAPGAVLAGEKDMQKI
jgi:hypothetical protein